MKRAVQSVFFAIIFLFSMSYVSALSAVSCIDSDFGKNYSVKGTILSNEKNYTDYCVSYSMLAEYYCSKEEENIIAETISCPCNDGKCVSCSDSDYGRKPDAMGEVITSDKKSYYDSCFSKGDQNFVKEYFCSDDKAVSEDLPCTGICYAGSCHGSCSEVAETCTGKKCGEVNGGCGKNISCGACSSGQICDDYQCVDSESIKEAVEPVAESVPTESVPAESIPAESAAETSETPITGAVTSSSAMDKQAAIITIGVAIILIILLIILKKIVKRKLAAKIELKAKESRSKPVIEKVKTKRKPVKKVARKKTAKKSKRVRKK